MQQNVFETLNVKKKKELTEAEYFCKVETFFF